MTACGSEGGGGSPAPPAPRAMAADGLSAERATGVSYTPAERAQLAKTVDAQLEQVRMRRAVELPFELAPALTFDPVVPGVPVPEVTAGVKGSKSDRGLPGTDDAIAFAPVTALASWLRDGAITSERLTELYLARLEKHGPALQCVVTLMRDSALAEARAADRELAAGRWRGPLHGVPYGAKDLLDTAGVRTSWGARPYEDRIAKTDAVVIERLRAAGAVLVAKLSLGALAYGDLWYGGRTRNPWNIAEGSSGSSAGSAAATAAGLVGFSIGTETLGSIVSPSMRCGTTGLRPTFGRVPRTGAMPLCWSLDKIGPICRSVEDTVHVLAAIDGRDPADPSSVDRPLGFAAGRADVRGRAIGYVPAWLEGDAASDLDRAAVDALRDAGANLVELKAPELPFDALVPLLFAEAAAAFEELTLSGRDDLLTWQDDDAWPNSFRAIRFFSAVDYVQADRLRRMAMSAIGELLAGVEAMVGPSYAPMLTATNFTGHPCVVLRAGFHQRKPFRLDSFTEHDDDAAPFRAPYGISLWGQLYDDGRVAEIAAGLEKLLRVASERPPLT